MAVVIGDPSGAQIVCPTGDAVSICGVCNGNMYGDRCERCVVLIAGKTAAGWTSDLTATLAICIAAIGDKFTRDNALSALAEIEKEILALRRQVRALENCSYANAWGDACRLPYGHRGAHEL